MSEEIKIGKVTHYFEKIGVAVAQLTGSLNVGNTIHIRVSTTDLRQKRQLLRESPGRRWP